MDFEGQEWLSDHSDVKSSFKVKQKPRHVIAKRNARERKRVQAVNQAFVKLRSVVPIQNTRGKRVSKVKTLLYAIDYIKALDQLLSECVPYCDWIFEEGSTVDSETYDWQPCPYNFDM